MTAETTLTPAVTLDMRGTSCPAPLLGAKRIVDDLAPGEVLLLLSDCPGTPDDLFAWSRHTDHHVVRSERRPDGSHAFYIQRGRAQHVAPNAVLDLTGVVCPGPIVEAKKLLGSMAPGETLKLVSNCPGIGADIPEWVKATGFALLATEEVSAGKFEFYIRKP